MANTQMSRDHKAALATGRTEAAAVRRYLDALEANRPRRGRKRTPESIKTNLAEIEDQLDDAPVMQRLELIQQRLDLTEELKAMAEAPDISGLEEAYCEVAASYGERKGVSYQAWRQAGVSAAVLRRAGLR